MSEFFSTAVASAMHTASPHTLSEVADVEQFEGHIACSSLSRSEIVVPVWRNNEIIGVLDIDSENLATFDDIDREWLEHIVALMS